MAELQARMSAREFAGWQAFYNLHPFGPLWADIRRAGLMALIAEIYRDPKRRRQPFGIDDFMPDGWHDQPATGEEPSPAALMAKVKAWAEGMKAT